MKSIIRVLDDLTINKIAAGEVIENPSSVVKELVENALDAGSTEIVIEIEAGGRSLVRISDNGTGMVKDDALLAFERHATSKLKTLEDLWSIRSMGFRGEALPSIASISRCSLLTADSTGSAHLVKMEGGKMLSCNSAAREKGTTLEVRDLFFNVPVRRKFLKSPASDETEISKSVILEALAHPELKFQLISNQKTSLLLYPTNLLERIEQTLGTAYSQELLPIDYEEGEYKISGYIGKPLTSRTNRSGQYISINQRPISSSFISWCVKEAYSTHLATGRQPIFVLQFRMPTDEVDVNVHPQKQEVRLNHENEIKRMIYTAIHQALAKSRTPHPVDWALDIPAKYDYTSFSSSKSYGNYQMSVGKPPTKATESEFTLPEIFPWEEPENKTVNTSCPIPDFRQSEISFSKSNILPVVLTTLKGFIIIKSENCDGISLIDQQRAHSRVIYEKLEETKSPNRFEKIALLMPLTFEFSKVDMELLKDNFVHLEMLGFELREFGPTICAIEAYPNYFKNESIEPFLQTYLAEIKYFVQNAEKTANFKSMLCEKASQLSIGKDKCLNKEEAEKLIFDLYNCKNPFESPVGRPIMIHLNREELAKQFQK